MSVRTPWRRRARPIAAALAVLLVVVVGWLLYDRTLGGGWRPTPGALDDVHVIDKAQPVDSRPAAILARLDRLSGTRWNNRLFQDRGAAFGGTGFARSASRLRTIVGLPHDPSVLGVATNLFDRESVRANGAAYLVWFDRPSRARAWLTTAPRAFADAELERRRASYLTGPYVLFYAPGEADRSHAVARTLSEAVRCPYHAGPCPG
jgi:hypothetical protein